MTESYIANLISVLRSTLQLLHYEIRGSADYTDEGFKEALDTLIEQVIGGNDGQPESRETEPEQREEG